MPLAQQHTYNVDRITPFLPTPAPGRTSIRLIRSTVFAKGTVLGELAQSGAVATTITPAITASQAAQTVAVAAGTNITVGRTLTVDSGANAEDVVVLAISGTNLTAVFIKSHGAGAALAAAAPTGSTGVYAAYASGNTDGTQVAKLILEYPCATDANGMITLGGATGGGPLGEVFTSTDAFYTGAFKTTELTGLDANAITNMAGKLISGVAADGVLVI